MDHGVLTRTIGILCLIYLFGLMAVIDSINDDRNTRRYFIGV